MIDYCHLITGITIGFAPNSYFVNEADGKVTLRVIILDGMLESLVEVKFFTTEGSATSIAPVDFQRVSGIKFVLDATTTSREITVNIVNDDIQENLESFYGNLSTANATVDLIPAAARVTIIDVEAKKGR